MGASHGISARDRNDSVPVAQASADRQHSVRAARNAGGLALGPSRACWSDETARRAWRAITLDTAIAERCERTTPSPRDVRQADDNLLQVRDVKHRLLRCPGRVGRVGRCGRCSGQRSGEVADADGADGDAGDSQRGERGDEGDDRSTETGRVYEAKRIWFTSDRPSLPAR